MSKRQSPCVTYDLTVWCSVVSYDDLVKLFKEHCRSWCFQKESTKSGLLHWQCRVKAKEKCRSSYFINLLPEKFGRVSPTSNENRDNAFYVMKEDSRVEGPWSDQDPYIPRQVREMKELWPWQKKIVQLSTVWDTRSVYVIVDEKGSIGKSMLCLYMGCYKMAVTVPYCNDYRDIMRMAMDRPKRGCYLIDLPKAINKERLYQLYSGIETLKNGYAYDDRYKFREEYFDCPSVFVFTNVAPNLGLLSSDRWKLKCVRDRELVDWCGFVEN